MSASRRSREGVRPRDFGLVLKPRPGSCRERPRRVTTSWSIPNSPPDGPQVLPAGRLYFRSALSQIVAFGRQFPDQLTKRIRQRRRAVLSAPRKNIPNRPGLQPQCSLSAAIAKPLRQRSSIHVANICVSSAHSHPQMHLKGAMSLPLKKTYPPMEARPAVELPSGPEWQYEPKWDGFRCLAFRDGKRVDLMSKSQKPLTRYFPELFAALAVLKAQRFVLDGEIVIPSDDG